MRLARALPAALLAAVVAAAGPSVVLAGGWIATGDARLRNDLQLLVDSGVLRIPLTTWPLPAADVRAALDAVASDAVLPPAESSALSRVRRHVARSGGRSLAIRAGDPGVLRVFDTQGREEAEVEAGWSVEQGRWSADVVVTAVASPRDDQPLRLDGTHATVSLGNWLLSGSLLERYWGPSYEGSLILGNDARPIPALTFDRATATAPASRWLSWVGPWRLTGMLGRMEGGRDDVDHPLFFGLRFTMRPTSWLELGASRTAQFCGDGRDCSLQTFVDMLAGRDNVGFRGISSPEKQPGNQLAGFDVRARSPWRAFPVALYAQDIGEDQVDLKPTDRLHLYGVESWLSLAGGSVLRGYLEYADTSCAASNSPPFFDCAYTNNIYLADGYRFRRRPVGHTTDADSESRAASVVLVRPGGDQWRLRVRNIALNRGLNRDDYHSQSAVPAKLETVELGLRTPFLGGELDLQLGMERIAVQSSRARDRGFGMVAWRRGFD